MGAGRYGTDTTRVEDVFRLKKPYEDFDHSVLWDPGHDNSSAIMRTQEKRKEEAEGLCKDACFRQ